MLSFSCVAQSFFQFSEYTWGRSFSGTTGPLKIRSRLRKVQFWEEHLIYKREGREEQEIALSFPIFWRQTWVRSSEIFYMLGFCVGASHVQAMKEVL